MSRLWQRYRTPLLIAMSLHLMLAVLLALDSSLHTRPAFTQDAQHEWGETLLDTKPTVSKPIVKAQALDQQAVMEALDRIKQAKQEEAQREHQKQQALAYQAKLAMDARLAEQKRLQAMKAEEKKLAIARKKALEKEKQRLQEMAKKQEQAQQALAALKTEQAALKKAAQAQQALAKEKASQQAQAAAATQAKQAAEAALKRARLAGEVDRYKAMILNAISHQWILPESVQPGLSSQFNIRLSPNGEVLDVRLTRGSGDAVLDRSAQTAIYKASPLPVPHDPATFALFKEISLTVRPENLVGG